MGIRTPQPEGCSAERSIRGQTPLTLYLQLAELRSAGRVRAPVPYVFIAGEKATAVSPKGLMDYESK